MKRTDELELDDELTVAGAAEILGVSPRTVSRYIDDGTLVCRNIAPLRSAYARYRIPLSAVLDLRGDYRSHSERQPTKAKQRRRPAKGYEPRALRKK